MLGTPEARRRVLHGDWHALLRDPIDLLRLHHVAGAIVCFALGRFHAAWQLVFSAVAGLLVRAVDPPRRFDVAFIVAMGFNGWGDGLRLFEKLSWYDNLVHTTLPFVSEADTANDLFDGFVGAGVGVLLLALPARSGMPVRRGSLGDRA